MKRLQTGVLATLLLLVLATASSAGSGGRELLLPNLIPLPPADLFGPSTGVVSSFGYGYPVPAVVVDGCLLDEIVRKTALRCLRFDTVVANTGAGHFEIFYKAEAPTPGAYQVVYRRDGTTRERFAVASEYHPTHFHFHFRNFYMSRLWAADRRGRIKGSAPVATGEKSGFCPEDSAPYSGGGGRNYSCLGDYRTDEIPVGQVVGISAGWSDAYRMHLPDQFIEVSGAADGYYVLQIVIDPDDRVAESNERDNSVCVLVSLQGERAALVGRVPSCPAAAMR